jgi:hypothetical protein
MLDLDFRNGGPCRHKLVKLIAIYDLHLTDMHAEGILRSWQAVSNKNTQ